MNTNLKSVDYLDVTLNLETGTHQPYRKPNDTPVYVNCDSNHPPSVIKQIPQAVEKRLSTLSSSEEIFRKAAPPYQEAVKESGYHVNIEYRKTNKDEGNKKEKQSKQKHHVV